MSAKETEVVGEDSLVWHGCYDGSWRDVIADESFAHP